MPPTTRPADRKLEPIHLKLLTLIEAGPSGGVPGEPVNQEDLALAMKPDPHMYAIEQMLDYGLIENPDPPQKRDWQLTRRGEQTLTIERKKAPEKPAEKPAKKPAPKTAGTTAPAQ